MADKKGLKQRLWELRSVTRVAYVLQLGTRVASSFMGLLWIRLLVGAMGTDVNGAWLAFQKVMSLGGLGDLGMGGAVGIRVGQYLGKDDTRGLQNFLASARTVFLFLAIAVGGGIMLLSPVLANWLHWDPVPAAGSFTPLFVVGGFLVAGVMLSSYLSNLNYACGNVTWPVIPTFVLLHLGTLVQWLLARRHEPLWVQSVPFLVNAGIGLWLTRFYIRVSHPALAGVFPLKFDRQLAVSLFESSFWIYLCSLGNAIYRSTDGLVISAGFNFGTLPYYEYNYKFCDIAVFVALTASFVSLPKITQWMASADAGDQQRARTEVRRLNLFQTMIGFGAALAYLAGNNLFMRIWWMHKQDKIPAADLALQLAFALNMAITASGDAGVQVVLRSGKRGLRFGGIMIGLTGLLNLGLSLLAMANGSLAGIAMATVAAQSILNLASSFYACRQLQERWLPWAVRGCLLPFAGVLIAGWLRWQLPFDSARNVTLLLGIYFAMALTAAWALGLNAAFVREELAIVRAFFRK